MWEGKGVACWKRIQFVVKRLPLGIVSTIKGYRRTLVQSWKWSGRISWWVLNMKSLVLCSASKGVIRVRKECYLSFSHCRSTFMLSAMANTLNHSCTWIFVEKRSNSWKQCILAGLTASRRGRNIWFWTPWTVGYGKVTPSLPFFLVIHIESVKKFVFYDRETSVKDGDLPLFPTEVRRRHRSSFF